MDHHKIRQIKQYLITNGIKRHKKIKQQGITNKRRSQSVGTFFGLTASILENIKFSKCPPLLIRQKVKKKSSSQSIGQQKLSSFYHSSLKTTMYHTRQMFLPIQKHRSLVQDEVHFGNNELDEIKCKHRTKKIAAFINHNSDYNSLKTVQNINLKSQNRLHNEVNFQITANRLPIIIKRQERRKQSLAVYEAKQSSLSPLSSKQMPKQQIPMKTLKIRNKPLECKGKICGWEVLELNQY